MRFEKSFKNSFILPINKTCLMEQENDVTLDEVVTQDVDTDIEDVETEVETEDYTSEDESEITYEQALEWKRKAERAEKAERALVEKKKQLKELNKKSESTSSNV
jgi:hypothetical protein